MNGDLISRQAVLDIVNNPLNIRLDEIIKKLPSVNPQEPIRCKDCIHNNNCDIQYHAQAGDMFYCGAGRK